MLSSAVVLYSMWYWVFLTIHLASLLFFIVILHFTFMFQFLLIFLFKSWYFSILSFSLSLAPLSLGTAMLMIMHFLSPLFTTTISGFLASIKWLHWIFTSHSIFTLSVSTTPSGQCSYHLSFNPRFYFLHKCQCMILSTLSCLCLYSLCPNFLHSLMM